MDGCLSDCRLFLFDEIFVGAAFGSPCLMCEIGDIPSICVGSGCAVTVIHNTFFTDNFPPIFSSEVFLLQSFAMRGIIKF